MLVIDSPEDLEPIIAAIVAKTLEAMRDDEAKFGDRIAFNEAEAARMISLESHQLADERRRGRISASIVVKRGIRYLRDDLLAYLARERSEKRI